MAAKKYLALIAGRIKQIAAVVVSAGSGNDGDLVALDASGKLDASVLPSGIGATTTAGTASEALSAGNVVNVWDDSGTVSVRKADATIDGKEATGFVKSSFSSSATATVYLPGDVITGLTSLTPGARYYLDTTAGAITDTAPIGSGNVSQCVGIALSTTTLAFNPEPPITVA